MNTNAMLDFLRALITADGPRTHTRVWLNNCEYDWAGFKAWMSDNGPAVMMDHHGMTVIHLWPFDVGPKAA
jgi:hypothetical protein